MLEFSSRRSFVPFAGSVSGIVRLCSTIFSEINNEGARQLSRWWLWQARDELGASLWDQYPYETSLVLVTKALRS